MKLEPATGDCSQRRELLVQNGLLAVERVRDPLVGDVIVISIGERARVMTHPEFRAWLDEVCCRVRPGQA